MLSYLPLSPPNERLLLSFYRYRRLTAASVFRHSTGANAVVNSDTTVIEAVQ
jgi:hypothetical protein